MNTEEAKNIFASLEPHGEKGCNVLSLSKETNISPTILRSYFKENSEFFCRVGETEKFVVNRFGKYQGDTTEMLNALDKKMSEHRKHMSYVKIAIAFLIGYALGSI
jgi:hypothetical protein